MDSILAAEEIGKASQGIDCFIHGNSICIDFSCPRAQETTKVGIGFRLAYVVHIYRSESMTSLFEFLCVGGHRMEDFIELPITQNDINIKIWNTTCYDGGRQLHELVYDMEEVVPTL